MADRSDNLQSRLDFVLDAARKASELILRYYHDPDLVVELKGDQSPVTVADRGAEELLREQIGGQFPDDGILGEEFDEKPATNGHQWILDPIDGTKSFIHGVPLFGTLIGLKREEELVLGVCRFPALDEVVYAVKSGGAWWQTGNGQPRQAHVTGVDDLSQALFCTTTITGWETVGRQDAFENFCGKTRLTRGWGDCYGHILVATGRADVMVDPALNPWDAAALLPILQEAGGHFLDWNGEPSIYHGNGFSVNDALKNAVLDILKT